MFLLGLPGYSTKLKSLMQYLERRDQTSRIEREERLGYLMARQTTITLENCP